MAKTKFFRIAVEGATATDGRTIKRDWIDQSVGNFNTDTYTPRINCEHIRGYSPEPPFNAYGSVIALKAEDVQIVIDGQTVTRRALYAQFDANDQLVAVNRKGQKIFTSCEFAEDFAQTSKAGLVGVAITDNPASLGTEALSFSALKPMWDSRKTDPANFFSAAEEIKFELDAAEPAPPAGDQTAFATAMAAVTAFFSGKKPEAAAPPVEPAKPANDNAAAFARVDQGLQLLSASVTALGAKFDTDVGALRSEFGTLKADLENTEQLGREPRKPATGGQGGAFELTDC